MAGSGKGQRRSVSEAVERAPAAPQFGKLPDLRCPGIAHGFVTSSGLVPDGSHSGAKGELGPPRMMCSPALLVSRSSPASETVRNERSQSFRV